MDEQRALKILNRFHQLIMSKRYVINKKEHELYLITINAFINGEIKEDGLKMLANVIYDCTEEDL